jgi:hypothetical protein
MTKRKLDNIEWVVTGSVMFHGVSCIVHAKDRNEAISKANCLDNIGGIKTDCAEVASCEFDHCEPNVDDSE